MGKGIIGTVKLAATLALAIPLAMLGADFLLFGGRPLVGAAFLGVAVLMVALEEYLTTPGDVPKEVAGRVVGRVAKEPEAEEGQEREA